MIETIPSQSSKALEKRHFHFFNSMHFAQTLRVKPIVVWEMGGNQLVELVKVVPSLEAFAFVISK